MTSDGSEMNGFLNVNKPAGRTSSDVVVFVRRRLPKGTAVGHGGTLDPDASGVLPVCVGSATRLFDYIIDKQKTYVACIRLGIETDTQDASGAVVAERPVSAGEAELRAVLPRFTGEIRQVPPMYSALKRDGKRLYKLARKGESVALEPRQCRVDAIEYLGAAGEDAYLLKIDCGKGVYIRTLCHDIGNALGCGGHMLSLQRAAAGIFRNFKMLLGTVVTAVGVALTVSFPWSAKLCGFSPLRLREWCAVGVLLVIQFAVWEYAKFYVAVKSRRYYQ